MIPKVSYNSEWIAVCLTKLALKDKFCTFRSQACCTIYVCQLGIFIGVQ